ncbi:MAG: Gfo/Idh/MocA family oxidoreductase [Candidatus Brockarchaeota archaeon]|nr:Gfo/Idh/MocA family oxidoreductase [Candidatus Brockarchaeota archaeon]
MSSPLRTAILGCGGIAGVHAAILSKLKEVKLVAYCDVRLEAANAFNHQYSAGKGAVYQDFREMLDKTGLDLLCICLPPFAHSDEVELAAEKNVNVFIEKPIALDMKTAERMVASVERSGVKSQVGFMFRFGEAVEVAKRMISSGEAGKAGLFTARYFCNSLHAPWWREREKSGGQVVEQVIHIYDVSRYLLGEVESAYCQMDNAFHREVEKYTSEDASATVLRFRNGALATIAATNGAIPNRWISEYKLVAKNATFYFEDANNATIYHTDRGWNSETQIRSQKNAYEAEMLDLINAVKNDAETRTPMIEGAKTLNLVLAVRRSAEEGKPVTLAPY